VNSFRSVFLARLLCSRSFVGGSLALSLSTGIVGLIWPNSRLGEPTNAAITVGVIFACGLNTKPYWMPTLSYPVGWFVAPGALLLLFLLSLSMSVMGGSPIVSQDGELHYYATSHGVLTSLSYNEFWYLKILHPMAFSAALVHFLLENKWRYNRLISGEEAQACTRAPQVSDPPRSAT
jgi:hypothetical protein